MGRRIIDESHFERPGRVVRRIASAAQLETLWDRYDSDLDGERSLIASMADEIWDYMTPRQADRICLSATGASRLLGLLLRIGIEPTCIVESIQDDLKVIRLLRTSGADSRDSDVAPSARFLGLALKRVMTVIRLLERTATHHRRGSTT